MTKRQIKLGAFLLLPGHHAVAWRTPEAKENNVFNFEFAKKLAQTAERGKFDLVFLADHVSPRFDDLAFPYSASVVRFEPLTLLSAIAASTEKIGLVATASTSYAEPYNLARQLTSLDYISNGRAAWNVVTSVGQDSAANFGQIELPHKQRYEKAEEFVEVVKKLWDSWQDDAIIYDQQQGIFTDKEKVQHINHKGQWFDVKGPLNLPRPPQGYPVIVQAGSSESGKELAAKQAEVIFTAWGNLEDAQAFYRDVKSRMVKYGRNPDDLKIMPGVFPIIGKTEQEAYEKKKLLEQLTPDELAVARLSTMLGIDLSQYDFDSYLEDLPDDSHINGAKSRFNLFKDLASKEKLTIRELGKRVVAARGHREIIGTPSQIADQLQEWFENEAADGFNVLPPVFPSSLDDFVDLVVPELQKRGIYRDDYSGDTLRDHLELKRPQNQFKRGVSIG